MAAAKGRLVIRAALQQALLCVWVLLAALLARSQARVLRSRAQLKGARVRAREEAAKPANSLTFTGRHGTQHSSSQASDSTPASAFRRLHVNGVLASFMPRPGLLRKTPNPKRQQKEPKFPFRVTCTHRNPITSSYSSTTGPWRLTAIKARAPVRGSKGRTPEEPTQRVTPASRVLHRDIPQENPAAAPEGKLESQKPPALERDPSRPRLRKTPLLLPYRRHEPLILPEAPDPGYRVTANDVDKERRAASQWINRVLSDDYIDSQMRYANRGGLFRTRLL
ncbi:putative POM121-like protein 1 [Ochotona princeps]|uniref:putative POM121-like protein 1 n=1 Tax=Ochotona princeps TaxID=9978 RepID=UPI0027150CD1|nr:putative POM121-like protein 1 [Ochotona princeps]